MSAIIIFFGYYMFWGMLLSTYDYTFIIWFSETLLFSSISAVATGLVLSWQMKRKEGKHE